MREALDGATYARVRELRGRLGAGDETLAAMALGRQEAEAVCEGVLAWSEANRGAWDARRQAVAAARRELAEAVRRVHTGRADEPLRAAVPQLTAAVAAARAAEQALIASAAASVEAGLTGR